ncbi:hypothetical protein F5Y16DRAFT_416112 [Xylariaceae sp. FL0255]|nr:hypothetical protein F5Y16DRAFT_416112 [Xylariaceae sp. FL0255]
MYKKPVKHGLQFALVKYELVYFTKNPKANSTHAFRLPHATIKASPSCRYLGVQIDTKLWWDNYRAKVEKKATKRLSALTALTSSTWPQVITGAFRTTTGAAVDIETHLLPVPQQLEQIALKTIICIRTTPLYDNIALQNNSKPKASRRQMPPFVYINLSAKKAIKDYNTIKLRTIRIYTDRNGINGYIGAVAVILAPAYRPPP